MKILFKAIVGSHAHGTNIEGSDIDIKGVYLQSPEDVLEHGYKEQVEISADETYYELKRFVELCCIANPTMLELLFSPEDCILEKDPIFNILLDHKEDFITKSCKHSYGGYAIEQIKKAGGLQKKMNWEDEAKVRKEPLDFCWAILRQGRTLPLKEYLDRRKFKQEECTFTKANHGKETYFLYNFQKKPKGLQSEDGNTIRIGEIDLGSDYETVVIYTEEAYSKHCKRYKDYTDWLENRNTQRYIDIENHNQKIDGKNMLHCIRLITMGKEIAEGKGLIVRRPEKDYLISIRRGQVDLQTLLNNSENLLNEMDELFKTSTLPEKVDKTFFMNLVIKMRKNYYNNVNS